MRLNGPGFQSVTVDYEQFNSVIESAKTLEPEKLIEINQMIEQDLSAYTDNISVEDRELVIMFF